MTTGGQTDGWSYTRSDYSTDPRVVHDYGIYPRLERCLHNSYNADPRVVQYSTDPRIVQRMVDKGKLL